MKKNLQFLSFLLPIILSLMMVGCRGNAPLRITLPEGAARDTVSDDVMCRVFEEVKTPYKYGLVMAPEDNRHKYDCPTVFRENGKWYMSYLCYDGRTNKDGRGYETWLAESDDLLHWTTLGRILSFRDSSHWDCNQRGGFMALENIDWGNDGSLGTYDGRHWMTYIGGSLPGYETTPLHIGLASTDGNVGTAHEWEALDAPLMPVNGPDAQWFERITQYKSLIYRTPDALKAQFDSAEFVMFYNAAGLRPETGVKAERIGMAFSQDMIHWHPYEGNPIFGHENGMITADAYIQRMGDLYVMFYFGAFWKGKPYDAFNTFACSYDLLHWTEWKGEDLTYPTEDYDNWFAHKSFLVKYKGVVYHFYCAVNHDNQRGIAVATSKDFGTSDLHFPTPEPKRKK